MFKLLARLTANIFLKDLCTAHNCRERTHDGRVYFLRFRNMFISNSLYIRAFYTSFRWIIFYGQHLHLQYISKVFQRPR